VRAGLDRVTRGVNRVLLAIGGIFLVGMCALTCANIFCRIVWVPIPGTYELMGYSGAVVAAFALGYTQLKRGHVAVDILVNSFAQTVRTRLTLLNCAVCAAFFILAAWQLVKKALTLLATGELTETLRIVYYPFTLAVAVGLAALVLALANRLLQTIAPQADDDP